LTKILYYHNIFREAVLNPLENAIITSKKANWKDKYVLKREDFMKIAGLIIVAFNYLLLRRII